MTRADGTLALLPRIALVALVIVGFLLAAVDPLTVLFFGSYVVVGLVLAIRRPRNVVSWLVVGLAFGFVVTGGRPDFDYAALTQGHGPLWQALLVWVGYWIGPLIFLGYAALASVFPSGHLPVSSWRRTILAAMAIAFGILAISTFQPTLSVSPDGVSNIDVPNPLAVLPGAPFWPVVAVASYVAVLAALAIGIASMLARYRRSDDQTKLQLRWLLAAISFVLVGIVFGLTMVALRGNQASGLIWIPAAIAYPCVPLAIGVAVLRYRLYEIDRIVNRALVYGVVTAILAGVFAAATALSQRLFISVAGQSSDAAVVLTTLIVVALYAPLRKRVEAVVDRYFRYDKREYGPYLDELQRLLDLIDPVRAAARLAREAQAQTRAIGVAVTNTSGVVIATAGTWPAEPIETVAVPVRGAPLGAVLVGPRRDGRPHPPARLHALADAAAVAVSAIGPEPEGLRRDVVVQAQDVIGVPGALERPKPADLDVAVDGPGLQQAY